MFERQAMGPWTGDVREKSQGLGGLEKGCFLGLHWEVATKGFACQNHYETSMCTAHVL